MRQFCPYAFLFCLFFAACKDKDGTRTQAITQDSTDTPTRKKDSASTQANKPKPGNDDSGVAKTRKDSILLKLTQDILKAVKNKNYRAVANYIDPVQGVRFSPYGYIDTIHHIKLSKARFLGQIRKGEQDKIVWGKYDATDTEILMTLDRYIQRFVYDVDYLKPEARSVNQFLGSGNSLNNLLEVYKDCDFTESHFSGFDKKYGGMDWKSLRLVFKEKKGKYLLVGIVHDEWTI